MNTIPKFGSSSVSNPVTLNSDVKQRKQRAQHNRPNPYNSYKTKKIFTSFYTEANPKIYPETNEYPKWTNFLNFIFSITSSETNGISENMLTCHILQFNELNRGHPTFFCQSQDEFRTKESEFVHFGPITNEGEVWLGIDAKGNVKVG